MSSNIGVDDGIKTGTVYLFLLVISLILLFVVGIYQSYGAMNLKNHEKFSDEYKKLIVLASVPMVSALLIAIIAYFMYQGYKNDLTYPSYGIDTLLFIPIGLLLGVGITSAVISVDLQCDKDDPEIFDAWQYSMYTSLIGCIGSILLLILLILYAKTFDSDNTIPPELPVPPIETVSVPSTISGLPPVGPFLPKEPVEEKGKGKQKLGPKLFREYGPKGPTQGGPSGPIQVPKPTSSTSTSTSTSLIVQPEPEPEPEILGIHPDSSYAKLPKPVRELGAKLKLSVPDMMRVRDEMDTEMVVRLLQQGNPQFMKEFVDIAIKD